MTFPIGVSVSENNLDSSSDSPSLARADLLLVVQYLNQLIASANLAQGVCVLDSSAQIASSQMPATIATATLTLNPTDRVVNIQNILRLTALPATDIEAIASPQIGDVAFSDDADSGDPAVCFYDGTDWRYLALSDLPVL
jgi:hypothetical protein